ncbi:TIGR04086 family membrane protein [Anaerocolumna aminovalerica]|jgi:putative membrane protein (TIGR04086 family)|uniref:TIGR04086 family membrane protein n=1 Tax=Anaerocolumna aminovalerica TaxID=1527 RepID=UPI001C0EF2AA|nr:TIGR04086 family membrane protein [Anaerocolumna aminovalerica]MBU5331670.1 TIGR04086 family membrane protein [Anaerocolumna aminovalerica]
MDKVLHRNSKALVILKDLVISYIATGILLLLLSFLMLKLDLSNGILSGGIILTYILSCFVGGFLLGKHVEQKRFLWGLLMGGLYFVILLFVSILGNTLAGIEAGRTMTVLMICLFSGMLGGMIS